jgi:hypothetical protein
MSTGRSIGKVDVKADAVKVFVLVLNGVVLVLGDR